MNDDSHAPVHEPTAMRETSIVALVVGVIATLLVLIVGVSVVGHTDKADAAQLLRAAPDTVRDAGSAKVTMAMNLSASGFDMDMKGGGVTEFATNRSDFTMSFLGTEMEVRSDGTTAFLRVPEGAKIPGVDKPWLSMPMSAFASNQQLAGVDSAAGMLDLLRGLGADTITTVGHETVNGVDATHYHLVVSLKDAIAKAPKAQRDRTEAALQQFKSLGAAKLPIDVWITDSGLPVRRVVTFKAPKGAAPGQMGDFTMKMQVDLTDFGTPVKVEAPPADQVQTVDPAKMGELFGGATS